MEGRIVRHKSNHRYYVVVGFTQEECINDNRTYPVAICADMDGNLITYFLPDLQLDMLPTEKQMLRSKWNG